MKDKIPIMLLSLPTIRKLGRRLSGLGRHILALYPSVSGTLSKMRIELEPEAYAVGSLVSSLIYGILFFVIALAALAAKPGGADPVVPAILMGLVFWLMFLLLHLSYPGIIIKKIATKENKDLLFALREVIIDVDGGVPLFDSLKNVANAQYGYVSADFDWVVRQIEGGVPEREALKQLAIKTESEYLKRAAWQMVNALESGARMGDALTSIVQLVENYLYRDIKNYSANLNFLMLIYMLGAVVMPSLGITFLVLLSAFSGLGVSIETIAMLLFGSAMLQVVMIGYMASTRPEIFGG